jgi:hypothetical protein
LDKHAFLGECNQSTHNRKKFYLQD